MDKCLRCEYLEAELLAARKTNVEYSFQAGNAAGVLSRLLSHLDNLQDRIPEKFVAHDEVGDLRRAIKSATESLSRVFLK